jgi:isocitrate dehydrogenase
MMLTKTATTVAKTALRTSSTSSAALFTTTTSTNKARIVYTKTDEAPMLATYAFLPIIKRFAEPVGVDVVLSDISVAARILCQFDLAKDELAALGELCKTPEANVIKLPNVSASIPQLVEAITELQGKGYDIPDFPANPSNAAEEEIAAKYGNVLGSSVNPVLREGNSDRRVAAPVKAFAQANPKKMGDWAPDCKSHVAHMTEGDFFESEQSVTIGGSPTSVRIEFEDSSGSTQVMKDGVPLQAHEVVDSSRMSISHLVAYLEKEIQSAKDEGIMLSLHLKATMMKVSDPIMFGHVVKVYYKDVFAKHAALFEELGVNPNNGLGDVYDKIKGHASQAEVEADIMSVYDTRPKLAMVDSRKGITNLHVPSDVIIDASMPNVVRDSGKMWNTDDALEDTKCLIPDRCYATFYQAVMDDCRANGQFDPATMGNVSNVGLMAQKAEEYGSHPYTFEAASAGKMRVVDENSGDTLMEHNVGKGDIWRMCTVKDAPIRDWVRLAVSRARATGDPAIFWLNEARAHDRSIIAKVNTYLPEHDTSGLDITIAPPVDAAKRSCTRAREGNDTISVTGNVLRDYLTDLFPILELGTSAKMLSIVPLLAGGGLYETGAGGSAPKHVQQFVEEGHLRWDSLGEYLALAVSLETLGETSGDENARLLGETLTEATGRLLNENKSPSRKVNEIDNRGSHFYIAKNWAAAMAKHNSDFSTLAEELAKYEDEIMSDLIKCQGKPMDIGGYYELDDDKANATMRPSAKFNELIDGR